MIVTFVVLFAVEVVDVGVCCAACSCQGGGGDLEIGVAEVVVVLEQVVSVEICL